MNINLLFTVVILSIEHSRGYLYRFIKPGYKHRIGKIKRLPELIPTQLPFYTKKENNTNTTINN